MKDFITELYCNILCKKRKCSVEVYQRFLRIKYNINFETNCLKARI